MRKSALQLLQHLAAGLFTLMLLTGIAQATEGYKRLSEPQPTANSDQVEVIEVFWYGCPHCYDFEPYLDGWLEKQPDYVDFKRLPAIFRQNWLAHAKAYYTAEQLGVVDKVHSALFAEIHKKSRRLDDEASLKSFFVRQGVDGDAFTETYNSDAVEDRVKESLGKLRRYEITGVPAVIINGKYLTSGPIAGSYEGMISAMNRLIKKERAAMEQETAAAD